MAVASGTFERVVRLALAEDVGDGDVTTHAVVEPDQVTTAELLLREPGTVSGLRVAELVFRLLDPEVSFEVLVDDGEAVDDAPAVVARVSGAARAILTGERTGLNFLGRLSGIATLTRRYVDAVAGTGVVILDTRKTTPGLRELEKYAVHCGGGVNHRLGLYDAILIKDNHLRLAGGVRAAIERVRASGTTLAIEIEAESLDDVREARRAGADTILLDNMNASTLRAAVALAGSAKTEASGGITLENVRAVAETGVDSISVGALTHSARSLDVSLELT